MLPAKVRAESMNQEGHGSTLRLRELNLHPDIKQPVRRCCTPAALAAIPAELADL